jgi:large subunit ribosomal protein L31e
MAVLERTYTIPLRKEWIKAPKYRRAKKAVRAVKEFLAKHMKAEIEDVRVGKFINLELWKHGIKNPPPRVRITVIKDDKGIVTAELFGHKIEAPKKEEKKEKGKATDMAGKIAEKIKGAVTTKPAEAKPAEKPKKLPKVEKKPEAKPAEAKPAVAQTKPAEPAKPAPAKPVPAVKPAA